MASQTKIMLSMIKDWFHYILSKDTGVNEFPSSLPYIKLDNLTSSAHTRLAVNPAGCLIVFL